MYVFVHLICFSSVLAVRFLCACVCVTTIVMFSDLYAWVGVCARLSRRLLIYHLPSTQEICEKKD